MRAPILQVHDLHVSYRSGGLFPRTTDVLHGVSLDVLEGEAVGLVGESGSGKSTLGRAVLGLTPVRSGRIEVAGQDVTHMSARRRRAFAASAQVVFQDPYTSLNPAMTIEEILTEPLRAADVSAREARRRVQELLDRVALPTDSGRRLAREFSGGQRQRIAIARALALRPRLVVCDEPVSALDLSTQSRVLELFIELQETTGVAYLFISHDLAVVRAVCHRVSVMSAGCIVESGDAVSVTTNPSHDYTRRLLNAVAVPAPARQRQRRAERRAHAATVLPKSATTGTGGRR